MSTPARPSVSTKARLRYAFDNTMSRGTLAMIGWLVLLSALVVVLAAAVVSIAGIAPGDAERVGFMEAAWLSLMRTLDPGTMGGDTGWSFRIVMLGVTLGGIFVISTLIGVLTSGIGQKLEELRKGRSQVVETGHTVILGWSEQVFDIVAELAIANQSRPGAAVAILAERDKVEMLDDVRRRVGPTPALRVVCRTGSPADPADVEMVSVDTARAIIILAPDGEPDPDAAVIKAVLAITNRPHRRREPYHIVAELRDEKNTDVLRLVAPDEIEIVVVSDLVARIIAQTCRQPGLSAVYLELLAFEGDEIYFHAVPAELAGRTFREALDDYEDSCVIGIRARGGAPALNPPMETRLDAGDELIFIAADDSGIRLSGNAHPAVAGERIIHHEAVVIASPERTLFLGWSRRGPVVLRELDAYVPPGSEVRIVAGDDHPAGAAGGRFAHLTATFVAGDPTDRRVLDTVDAPGFDHVIVLAPERAEASQADARTIVTLLHLRDIAERAGATFSIVTEMLDERNRLLVEGRRAEDFIVSKRLVGLVLSQISEHKALAAVFADLFDPEGAEVYLRPVATYVAAGGPVNFYTLVEAAAQRREVAVGYRLSPRPEQRIARHRVIVNPRKAEPIEFNETDQIIVIAEG
ncbi:MAG: CASTOR/POLLUX-related putative ion channel [bacterium]